MTKFFISYRRDDSEAFAGRLAESLRKHFGEEAIFIDVESIPFGVDFRTHVEAALNECTALIVIIGEKWLEADRNKFRRLEDPEDFVRVEIRTALNKGVPVVPVTVKSTSMPRESDLPEDLRPLAFRNACAVDTGRDYYSHVERLISNLESFANKSYTDPTRQSATDLEAAPRPQQPSKHFLALITFSVLLSIFAFTSIFNRSSKGLIETFKVNHIGNAGDRALFEGPLFRQRTPRVQDDIEIEATFTRPVYCFLLALNPDGSVQLCYPQSASIRQEEPIERLRFPDDPELAFGLTDGAGQQGFFLVTSIHPLPPFNEWQAEVGQVNWPDKSISGDWTYSNGWRSLDPLHEVPEGRTQRLRGETRRKKNSAQLREYLQSVDRNEGVEVRGVLFRVIS